jgi:hypothetical protein
MIVKIDGAKGSDESQSRETLERKPEDVEEGEEEEEEEEKEEDEAWVTDKADSLVERLSALTESIVDDNTEKNKPKDWVRWSHKRASERAELEEEEANVYSRNCKTNENKDKEKNRVGQDMWNKRKKERRDTKGKQ